MPTPWRAARIGSLARLIPSRPQGRPTPAELENRFARAAAASIVVPQYQSSAQEDFEGNALNQTTFRSETTVHGRSLVNNYIPEAVKASVRGRTPTQPKKARAPKKGHGRTEYVTTKIARDA